jgi:hypothetical protein
LKKLSLCDCSQLTDLTITNIGTYGKKLETLGLANNSNMEFVNLYVLVDLNPKKLNFSNSNIVIDHFLILLQKFD